jgi:heme oxygenase
VTAPTATVAERLRAQTRAWHDALEATPFATAMVGGTLPIERYVAQLAAHRVVLEALEGELSRAVCPSVAAVWSPDLAKLPLLDSDLRHFAARGTAPRPWQPWAVGEAQEFAREIRLAAASDPQALLGFLYVLEGSTLGGLILRRYVTRAYGLCDASGGEGGAGTDGRAATDDTGGTGGAGGTGGTGATDGAAYYGSGDRDRWARFTARLNRALAEPEAQDRVIHAAGRAYHHIAAIAKALSAGLSGPA